MRNPQNPFSFEFEMNTLRQRENQTLQHSPSDSVRSAIEIQMQESTKHEFLKKRAGQVRADVLKNENQSRTTTLNEIFTEDG